MGDSRKKVIVRRFSPGVLAGYLPAVHFVQGAGEQACVDLLDLTGRAQPVLLADVKYISFVRDFNSGDLAHPERLLRKIFQGRPRSEGLWLRIALRDDDLIEGLAPLDLSLVDGLLEDGGVQITPPDIRGNTQRLYIPRLAMSTMQIVAVITTPSRRPAPPAEVQAASQTDLFSPDLPSDRRP